MSNIAKILGQRIRNYRLAAKLSQEKLAELSGCHHSYIGQIERGEKHATIESIERIAAALNIPLARLFEKLGVNDSEERNIPLECYEFILSRSKGEQELIYRILLDVDKYKNS